MKKRSIKRSKSKTRKLSKKTKSVWAAIIFIILILGAVITGLRTDVYPMAIGILIGFLASKVIDNI